MKRVELARLFLVETGKESHVYKRTSRLPSLLPRGGPSPSPLFTGELSSPFASFGDCWRAKISVKEAEERGNTVTEGLICLKAARRGSESLSFPSPFLILLLFFHFPFSFLPSPNFPDIKPRWISVPPNFPESLISYEHIRYSTTRKARHPVEGKTKKKKEKDQNIYSYPKQPELHGSTKPHPPSTAELATTWPCFSCTTGTRRAVSAFRQDFPVLPIKGENPPYLGAASSTMPKQQPPPKKTVRFDLPSERRRPMSRDTPKPILKNRRSRGGGGDDDRRGGGGMTPRRAGAGAGGRGAEGWYEYEWRRRVEVRGGVPTTTIRGTLRRWR